VSTRGRREKGDCAGLHRSEAGLTLIEMIITIALITIAIVGITGAVASTERLSAVNQSQAKLEIQARQVADFVRDSRGSGLAYHACADNVYYNAHLGGSAPAGGGTTWIITKVNESMANQDLRNGSSTGVTPAGNGVTGGICSVTVWDYGVQEIWVKVCETSCMAANRSLTRIVWKSRSW